MQKVFLTLFLICAAGGWALYFVAPDTSVKWWKSGEQLESYEERHHYAHDMHVFHVANMETATGEVSRSEWLANDGEASRFAQYDANSDGMVDLTELTPPATGYGPGNVVDIFTNRTFLWTCANVFFLLFLFVQFGGKPVSAFLTSRRNEVAEGLEEAQRLQAEADALRTEYESRLAQLDDEMAQLRGELRAAGEAEKERLIHEAEAKASRLRKDTAFLIEQRMKVIHQTLTTEAVETAIAAAEQVLRDKVSKEDQLRVATNYLGLLGTSTGKEGRA
jgi:F-type H+-transporting ATPase subunit b